MRWNLIKESGRPLHEDQTRWDNEKHVNVRPASYTEE